MRQGIHSVAPHPLPPVQMCHMRCRQLGLTQLLDLTRLAVCAKALAEPLEALDAAWLRDSWGLNLKAPLLHSPHHNRDILLHRLWLL